MTEKLIMPKMEPYCPIPVAGDALIIVDVQNDFLPTGSLPVPNGDTVVPALNCYLAEFERRGLPVFATRDWHPSNHESFREQGGIWPSHCVAGTPGGEFAVDLNLFPTTVIISKGTEQDVEGYSGFERTDLDERLKRHGVRRLFLGGLATDYCVLATVKGARELGYDVCVLEDAIRAVNTNPGDEVRAKEMMVEIGCSFVSFNDTVVRSVFTSAMTTDWYQLTMMQGYFDCNMREEAVFEFFIRRLPKNRGFLVSAGLEQVLDFLENLQFTPQERGWLNSCSHLRPEFVQSLESFRFEGDVHALPEGTIFFPNEPVLRITAPLPQGQLVETCVINFLQYQTMVASKAARMVIAGNGRELIDFGCRRAHSPEAGILAARAAYLAGFDGTATVIAGMKFGIPLFGTMAHSFIQAHEKEAQAFENFARSHPGNVVLLLDTYDIETAARRTVKLAKRLKTDGIAINAVRLDSGDLKEQARRVRAILDEGGCGDIRILVSGNLDENALQRLNEAPIDGFGIGTLLTTSADVPYLECAYKLQEFAGQARRKFSEGKATFPGRKQIFRKWNSEGVLWEDVLCLEDEIMTGTLLMHPVMKKGRRLFPSESIHCMRDRVARELSCLPTGLRILENPSDYVVRMSPRLKALAETIRGEIGNTF